ncbi:Hsp20/alpha crystallin family protein [Rhizobium sp. LjRoot98]|uniref:Hsp20/alpha crystallin family protein n=1 Tax=unclassified Rhizobium TaxID=2613769 RepID=UPI00071269EA|nr:Hsp20/alpha crystallin family protein [Rhizobium sp. Root1204]KQV36696.1 molecular chaperone Hsp20 [Rhizobium sp. Root1204]
MAEHPANLPTNTEPKTPSTSGRWSPFEGLRSEFDRVFNDFTPGFLDRTFSRLPAAFHSNAPAIDFVEKDDAFELTAELPGIDPKELDVTLSDGILTLKGEKNEREERKDGDYYLSERRYGSFRRDIRLPEATDPDKIDASFANGLLKITLPKTPNAKKNNRKIAIKTS